MALGRIYRCYLVLAVAGMGWTGALGAQIAIDTGKSTMTVQVSKAGLLSALGHNHEITAPVARGSADPETGQVELRVAAGSLRVRDQDISDKDRAQIQSTMTGPEVLDATAFPEIVFRSDSAEKTGAASWRLTGSLTLHGQSRPVAVEVRETGGHYLGASHFKQTDFGITPVKAAGGTIRVKDEVRIEFDIQLAR